MCNTSDPLGCLGDAGSAILSAPGELLSGAADQVAGSAFDKFVQTLVDGANWAIQSIMTLWLKAPDPEVTGKGSTTVWISDHVAYLVAATMIGSLILAGARLAIYGKASDAVSAAEALVRSVVVSVLAGVIITAGLSLSDAWASWILDQSKLDLSVEVLSSTVPSGVLWLLAIVVILTQIIQLAFMIVRNAVVVLLAGTLTWAAAASGTRTGRQWFEKSVAWLVAFIVYKPAAALIYAVAFKMASEKDLYSQLSGIFLMILSIFALPALMRLIMPMTAQIGGANAGALAGATVGAAVAMGAMAATGGASAAASSGAGGFGSAGGTTGGGGFGVGTPGSGPAGSASAPAAAAGGGSSESGRSVTPAGSTSGSDSSIADIAGAPDNGTAPGGAEHGEGSAPPAWSATAPGTSSGSPAGGASSGAGTSAGDVLRSSSGASGGISSAMNELVADGDQSDGPSGSGRTK